MDLHRISSFRGLSLCSETRFLAIIDSEEQISWRVMFVNATFYDENFAIKKKMFVIAFVLRYNYIMKSEGGANLWQKD